MIMIFEQVINGRKAHCEIRCPEQDAETHRMAQAAGGWKLISIIGRGEKYTNEGMKLSCVHGSCCEDTNCIGCDDFEFR